MAGAIGNLQGPFEILRPRGLRYLKFDRHRARQAQVFRPQRIAAVSFGRRRVRGAAQHDRHSGIPHGCVVDQATEMNGHPIVMNQPDRQQVLGPRFYAR